MWALFTVWGFLFCSPRPKRYRSYICFVVTRYALVHLQGCGRGSWGSSVRLWCSSPNSSRSTRSPSSSTPPSSSWQTSSDSGMDGWIDPLQEGWSCFHQLLLTIFHVVNFFHCLYLQHHLAPSLFIGFKLKWVQFSISHLLKMQNTDNHQSPK